MADNTNNSQNNNIIDSIKQNAIIEGLDKTADTFYASITKSYTKGEITAIEANTAKYVPKKLWNLSGFLNKFCWGATLVDILKNNKEPLGQKIITDGPRLSPGWFGFLGEVWNSLLDKAWGKHDDVQYTIMRGGLIVPRDGFTTGQAINIAESDPFLSEGVFNGQILDGQKAASYEDEIWGNNKLQGSSRVPGALQGRVSKNQSFLESFGLEDMHKQNANLYNFANGASLNAPNAFSQDDNSGQSFLESLGLPDMQKQYASLSTFGGYGLNLIDNSRTIFQTDIAPTSEAIGTSGSVLFNNNLGGVSSSETYKAGISQTSSNDPSQDGMLLGVGAAGFFFNPAALIVVAVGFIVSWLNSIFCRD